MKVEGEMLRTDPVAIRGPRNHEEYCPATHYPNHYKETAVFINTAIPTLLELAGKEVIAGTPVATAPSHADIQVIWVQKITSEIVSDIQKRLRQYHPELDEKLAELIFNSRSNSGFIDSLSGDLLFDTPNAMLGPHKAQTWVPREWQPIIVERGIVGVLPTFMCDVFKSVYRYSQQSLDIGTLDRCYKDNQPKFESYYEDIEVNVNCLGRAASQHIIYTSTLNYALKLQGVSDRISSIDLNGQRKSKAEVMQEYTDLTS